MYPALISTMELFEIDLSRYRHDSLGWLENCRIGILKLPYLGEEGLAECLLCTGNPSFDLVRWGGCLRYFCGLTLNEAITATAVNILKQPDRGQYPLALMALLDVRSHLEYHASRKTSGDQGMVLEVGRPGLNRSVSGLGTRQGTPLRFGGAASLAVHSQAAAAEAESPLPPPANRLPLLGPDFPTDTPALIRRSSAYLSLFGRTGAYAKNRYPG